MFSSTSWHSNAYCSFQCVEKQGDEFPLAENESTAMVYTWRWEVTSHLGNDVVAHITVAATKSSAAVEVPHRQRITRLNV
jgi:hypothetical protein